MPIKVKGIGTISEPEAISKQKLYLWLNADRRFYERKAEFAVYTSTTSGKSHFLCIRRQCKSAFSGGAGMAMFPCMPIAYSTADAEHRYTTASAATMAIFLIFRPPANSIAKNLIFVLQFMKI